MTLPTPAVRAALVALVASALAAVAGGWLHVSTVQTAARADAREALDTRVALVADALAPAALDRNTLLVAFAPFTRAAAAPHADTTEALALVDAEGRVVATTRAAVTRDVPWRAALGRAAADGGSPQAVVRGGETLWVAARALGPSGYRVAALRPVHRLPDGVIATTVTTLVVLWGLLAALSVGGAYLTGPYTRERLTRLGRRLAQPDAQPDALLAHAERHLGPLASVFAPLVKRVGQLGGAVAGAREHVGALYQVNPHYVLLCTMDGRIVEANPAFYAITGLPPEALRGGRVEALAEVFPVEPLMELAQRSLREGASIGGIEYAIQDRDDSGRPVEVALRAFRQGDTSLVLFQATDVAVRRTLERRVAAFSDTLDLMVDQRVQQITSGQQSLRRVLDTAGVAVASFDRGGATRRWSGAMQALAGRAGAEVPHFATAAASLGLEGADRAAFVRWFWSDTAESFAAVHTDPDGHARPLVWRRVDAEHAGSADYRTIVGVEVPAPPSATERLAADALDSATGDGAADADRYPHAVPTPAR